MCDGFYGKKLNVEKRRRMTHWSSTNLLISEIFFVFQVNNNGHLSFDYEVPVYLPTLRLGSRYKLIAVFLSDIDTSAAGSVYYRFVFSSGVALN